MTGNRKIVLLGGGGHSKVLIDLISLSAQYEIAGILDGFVEKGMKVMNIPVLGGDELLPGLYEKGITDICIAVGSTGDNSARGGLYRKAKAGGFNVPSLVHPRAVVSGSAGLAEGVQVMAGAVIQTDALIGENTIINTGAIVEHDCAIGKNVHICPGVTICGSSEVGDDSFIGAGSVVKQGVKIGSGTTVGAGALVLHDIPDGVKVKGVPAR